jgi:hypothetical protein
LVNLNLIRRPLELHYNRKSDGSCVIHRANHTTNIYCSGPRIKVLIKENVQCTCWIKPVSYFEKKPTIECVSDCCVSWLTQQSVDRHVAPVGHIILIPGQPVCVFSPYCCGLSQETTRFFFIVFGLTRPGLEPTIYHTWGEHYTTDAVTTILINKALPICFVHGTSCNL